MSGGPDREILEWLRFAKGDTAGHDFHGNQYQQGESGTTQPPRESDPGRFQAADRNTDYKGIIDRVQAEGGISIHMLNGHEPTTGYMVAKGVPFAAIVPTATFQDPAKGTDALHGFFVQHQAELSKGDNYLGLWENKDEGQVYLDVTENIQDKATAVQAGKDRDQQEIWDVVNGTGIDTGGSGKVDKSTEGISKMAKTNSPLHLAKLPDNFGTMTSAQLREYAASIAEKFATTLNEAPQP